MTLLLQMTNIKQIEWYNQIGYKQSIFELHDYNEIPQDLYLIEVEYNDNNMMNINIVLMETKIKLTKK